VLRNERRRNSGRSCGDAAARSHLVRRAIAEGDDARLLSSCFVAKVRIQCSVEARANERGQRAVGQLAAAGHDEYYSRFHNFWAVHLHAMAVAAGSRRRSVATLLSPNMEQEMAECVGAKELFDRLLRVYTSPVRARLSVSHPPRCVPVPAPARSSLRRPRA
jgi:hypothetical protein